MEKILTKGEVKQAALSQDIKDALNLYRDTEVNSEENVSFVNGNYIIHKNGCNDKLCIRIYIYNY